jgi:hypothetical protein
MTLLLLMHHEEETFGYWLGRPPLFDLALRR